MDASVLRFGFQRRSLAGAARRRPPGMVPCRPQVKAHSDRDRLDRGTRRDSASRDELVPADREQWTVHRDASDDAWRICLPADGRPGVKDGIRSADGCNDQPESKTARRGSEEKRQQCQNDECGIHEDEEARRDARRSLGTVPPIPACKSARPHELLDEMCADGKDRKPKEQWGAFRHSVSASGVATGVTYARSTLSVPANARSST